MTPPLRPEKDADLRVPARPAPGRRRVPARPVDPWAPALPLTTRDGWEEALHNPPQMPDLADSPVPDEAVGVDEHRLQAHMALGLVGTPDSDRATRQAKAMLRDDAAQTHGRSFIAVDGLHGTGKTSLLHTIGRAYQADVELRTGGWDPGRIPVVCINTPAPDSRGRVNFSVPIALFLKYELFQRPQDRKGDASQGEERQVMRLTDWTVPITARMRQSGTRVLLVDGIDQLGADGADVHKALTYLKALSDELQLTVFLCGTGATDILRTWRGDHEPPAEGRTAAARGIRSIWAKPIPYDQNDWTTFPSVLEKFADKLRLHRFQPHDLLAHTALLHQISGGYMDPLAPLIRMTAHIAIEGRTEAITTDVVHEAADTLGMLPAHPAPPQPVATTEQAQP